MTQVELTPMDIFYFVTKFNGALEKKPKIASKTFSDDDACRKEIEDWINHSEKSFEETIAKRGLPGKDFLCFEQFVAIETVAKKLGFSEDCIKKSKEFVKKLEERKKL